MTTSEPQQSPFLRLPFELRLQIYEYLLLPSSTPAPTHSTSIDNLSPQHPYYTPDPTSSPTTLTVRTIDPSLPHHAPSPKRRLRTTYHIRTGPFQTHTTPTTYTLPLPPTLSHLHHTIPSLLPLSRQIHTEASSLLYSTYTFSFDTAIEAIVPFLSDLTPVARASLRYVQITKKPLPYVSEFDRAEWACACRYLGGTQGLRLQRVALHVVGGRPGVGGWEGVEAVSAGQLRVLARVRGDSGRGGAIGGVDLEWVEQVMGIKGLRDVDVRAVVEHCPPPRSETMAFWVAFSRSIEGGFADWVRGEMVAKG
ncbi:hypothetical protein EJ04DRAFT_221721 [Polyplosphaeria fusca]|uniref:Uncharacterized protein n=1 Tax=Polyplosphaeria fusca TaxID=682080 RepID=A0A9P4QY91_9PLEO|nr:hypothetical protein EJ04DRAFT_221721 [Polyplosphaeria fusca]